MPKGHDRIKSPKKDRTQKVNNFKNQQRLKNKSMSNENEIPQSPVAEQYPAWSSKADIIVSGLEWEAIYGLVNMFSNAVMASQAVLNRNMQSGVIKWVYKDEKGNDVPVEEVEKFQAKIQEYFAKQQKGNNVAPATDSQEGVPHLDAIVRADGQPIK